MITQKVFTNDLEGRIDPHYYKPEFLRLISQLNKKGRQLKPLNELARKIASGATPKSGGNDYTNKDDGIPFIRSGDINEDEEINYDEILYIKEGVHNKKLQSSKLQKDDVLIAIVGATIGRVSVYRDTREANINQAIALVRCNHEINPRYIKAFLLSGIGQKQLERIKRPVARANINLEEVGNIKIPLVSLPVQNKIADIIQNAYSEKEAKLRQADELHNSIDAYIRQQLGIDYTEPEEEKIYTVSSRDLHDNRQDPYYYNPKFVNLLSSVGSNLKMTSLSGVAEGVFNGNTPAKEKYADEGKPIVKVSCLKRNKIEWSNLAYAKDNRLNKHLKDNDILLLSSAHQAESLGKNPCLVEIPDTLRKKDITFVGELICIRPNTKLVNPYYLLAILRLGEYHQLINREKRGQTSHIYPDDLEKIKIPLADKGKQDSIAREFKNRIDKAEELKNEASELLEDAKKKVEEMILN